MLQKSLFWRIVGIDDQDVDVAKSVFSTLNLRHYGLQAPFHDLVTMRM